VLPTMLTKRLVLRPWNEADIDDLYVHWTDADVRRYLWDDAIISRECATRTVQSGIETVESDGIGYWIIQLRLGSPLIGFCGFRFIDREKSRDIELMYGLHGLFWGMGLATEACQTILGWLWNSTSFSRVYGRTDPPNTRSIGVLKRLGMTLVSSTRSTITYVSEAPRSFEA